MKNVFALLVLLVLLAGCSAETAPAMYIEPAKLNEEEEAVAKLLGADMDQHLFDVVLDGTAKKMCVTAYELADGTWKPWIGGGGSGMALDEKAKEGRLCFGFEDLRKDFREAAQFGERGYTATSWEGTEDLDDPEGMGRTTSFLAGRTEIVYEREIPIAIQINTTKNQVLSYDPEYFFQPEEYEKLGYEHVYALTVTFSQEPLSQPLS